MIYTPGRDFTPELVKDADALIIRTRTRCNKELLEGSKVRFIATATIGFDHIDTEYCREAGIAWTNAPGCNSASVAQYVQSALLLLQQLKGVQLSELTLGIIGVGNVGSKIAQVGQELGMRVLKMTCPAKTRKERAISVPCKHSQQNVISSPSTYLYIRKGHTKHSIWQTILSSGH